MNHPQLPLFSSIIETDVVIFFVNKERNTLIVKYKESCVITKKIGIEIIEQIRNYEFNFPIYGMTDATARHTKLTRKAQRYFAKKMRPSRIQMHAIIVNDLATILVANFFKKLEKPKIPTKIFNSPKAGLQWIESNSIKATTQSI